MLQRSFFNIILMVILEVSTIAGIPARPAHSRSLPQETGYASASFYQWHTFMGNGDGIDQLAGMVTDSTGDVILFGSSSTPWNGPAGQPPLHAHSRRSANLVIIKLRHGVYQWHTFYGGGYRHAFATGLAVDSAGNIFVSGQTLNWNGPQGQAPLRPYNTQFNEGQTVVLKLSNTGSYLWHTFYLLEHFDGLAADPDGNLIATGVWFDWQGPNGELPLHTESGSGARIAILKLSANGAYLWHTFYGASESYSNIKSFAITSDATGNIYLTGSSSVNWNGDQSAPPLHPFNQMHNIFVMKLASNGAYRWHTFYGEPVPYGYPQDNNATAIAVDNSGSLLVGGVTRSSWAGDNNASPLNAHSCPTCPDNFALMLTLEGAYQWHTFYPASSDAYSVSLTPGPTGEVFLAGVANPFNGPGGEAPLNNLGYTGMLVLKLSANGAYQWHTFYAGDSYNQRPGIGLDPGGAIYVAGNTHDNWTGPAGQQPVTPASFMDIFWLQLDAGGSYQQHGFFGTPESYGVISSTAVDRAGNIYLLGYSQAEWPGPQGQAPLHHSDNPLKPGSVVVKLDPNGNYLWHTYFGSAVWLGSIEIDDQDFLYLAGNAGLWFGPEDQWPLHMISDANDLLLVKLDGDGGYLWHTYYGSNIVNVTEGGRIALDPNGGVYMVWNSYCPWNGPAGQLPLQPYRGECSQNHYQIAILRLTANGAYDWHTFLGPIDTDVTPGAVSVTVSPAGSIYVAANSLYNFSGPDGQAALHPHSPVSYTGNVDAVIIKLSSAGAYQWHTFYGSVYSDYAADIKTDSSGSIYMTGGGPQWQGDDNAWPIDSPFLPYSEENLWVIKLNNSGQYQWHTYAGPQKSGVSIDVNNLEVGDNGTLVVFGDSNSAWTGSGGQTPLHPFYGNENAFVIEFTHSGAYQWHTFYGNQSSYSSFGQISPADNAILISGTETYDWIEPNLPRPVQEHSGGHDFFTVKLSPDALSTYTVSGTIKDIDGRGIEGVAISADALHETTSDVNGQYMLGGLIAGKYSLSLWKDNYTFSPNPVQGFLNNADQSDMNVIGSTANWTLMYYLNGDNNLSSTYLTIFNQLALANQPAANVVALLDTSKQGDTAYYRVQYGKALGNYTEGVNKWSKDELNMSDPQTLVNFVTWARKNYPGRHFVLIMDDHGSGLSGAMNDFNDNWLNPMPISRIKSALAQITSNGYDKLDILVMNACLMGMIEDAYEFRNYADYYVASENLQNSYSTGYTKQVQEATAAKLPLQFAMDFVDAYANDWRVAFFNYTMSVMDLSQIDEFVLTINGLSNAINTDWPNHAAPFAAVLSQVQRFDNEDPRDQINQSDTYGDLYDFARLAKEKFTDQAVKDAAQALMDKLPSFVVYNVHAQWLVPWQNVDNSHGVSVSLPDIRTSYYTGQNYDFADGTVWLDTLPLSPGGSTEISTTALSGQVTWGQMLANYFAYSQPNGPDDPTPPQAVGKNPYYEIFLPRVTR